MANERPQLSLPELHQLRWLLGGLLSLVAIWSVWYLDIDASALLLLASASSIATTLRPSLAGRIPRFVHALAFPVAFSLFAFDLYTVGQFLPALVRLAVLLLWYRGSTYRKRRDDLQLVLLGLFMIVTAGVLTVSIGFALQIIVFAALALGLLFTRTLIDAAESDRGGGGAREVPTAQWVDVEWSRFFAKFFAVLDWRVWFSAVALFCMLVGVSALLFLAIPRFQLESSLFLDRLMNKRSVSGFTDTLRFGEVSDIQKDESVALRIDVSDPAAVPDEPYWRMIVMDEYRDGAFRMSEELKRAAFSREQVRIGIEQLGAADPLGRASWTFYVEPGVSRYLPVLGSFVQLRFTEPQQFRTSNALRLIALSREPASMKAFRIERMSSGSSFREPSPSTGSAVPRHLYMDTSGAAADRALWQRAVDEIVTELRTKSAAEFARAATTWLQRRHAYALSNAIPPGPGDPLVRWTLSDQPGHCELFAGAFAMLARTAGYPARIVGGFFGGSWNGDFLVVRNSNAHAWCEIFDGESHWLRVDATAPVPEQNPTARQAAERQRGRLPIERGFAASLDRLRMLWYRRVVQFDRNDQLTMAQSLREKSASLGKQLRGWMQYAVDNARSWLARPWTGRRALNIALGVAAGAGLISWWRAKGRAYWLNWRSRHSRGMDPIRQEAGKWLQRLQVERLRNESANTPLPIEESLQRLRFGPRPTWPDPFAAFAEARSALRARRRARGKRRD